MHVLYEKCYSIVVEKPYVKSSLGRHKGRYILKWILKVKDGKMWTGFLPP
jgi:hypothetical protein